MIDSLQKVLDTIISVVKTLKEFFNTLMDELGIDLDKKDDAE